MQNENQIYKNNNQIQDEPQTVQFKFFMQKRLSKYKS